MNRVIVNHRPFRQQTGPEPAAPSREGRRPLAHDLLRLAREALLHHLGDGPQPSVGTAGAPQACFVSLKRGGKLRGCIGTLAPTRTSVEEEVMANAIAAATRDPRFEPVLPPELRELRISIDLLSMPEPVESESELDPRRFGLIVTAGSRCGVLLPDLPSVETVARQIAICREKAEIAPHERVALERFTVSRLQEEMAE